MRTGRIGLLGGLGGLLALAAGPALATTHHYGRTAYPKGWRNIRGKFIPASINRHTGKPHEHKREIARRTRQAENRAAKAHKAA